MKVYHVVAAAKKRVIGKDNQLPWHFSSDLKFFKNLTMGNTILMGRKTHESIGKALPGRDNYVLTSNPDAFESAENLRFFKSFDEALQAVTTEKCFVIGGASIYEQTIQQVDGIYLNAIDAEYEGDAFYPGIPDTFKEQSRERLQDEPVIDAIFYENVLQEKS